MKYSRISSWLRLVRALFAVGTGIIALGVAEAWAFDCPIPPPVTVNIDAKPRYSREDPSRSTVDRENLEYNEVSLGDLRDLLRIVGTASDAASRGDSGARACLETQLTTWAKGEGLLGDNTALTSRVNQRWALSAIAIAVYKSEPLSASARPIIVNWLREIARHAAFESRNVPRARRNNKSYHNNNLYYWLMLGVGVTGWLAEDRELEAFATDGLKQALGAVGPDGTLRAELARGKRALAYHAFASQPLVSLSAIARSRGIELSSESKHGLARLMCLLRQPEEASVYVGKLVGKKQISLKDQPVMPLYIRVFPDLATGGPAPATDAARDFVPYLGGSVSALSDMLMKSLKSLPSPDASYRCQPL